MLKYMLDANICICAIKNKPAHVRDRFSLHYGERRFSMITLMELMTARKNGIS